MNLIRHTDSAFSAKLNKLIAASSLFDPVVEQRALEIIRAVQRRGDKALLHYTEKFDGAKLTPGKLHVGQAELAGAWRATDARTRKAIRLAKANVTLFAKRSLRKNWQARNAQGGVVGEKFDPFARVGVYIPGGTAPLASTTLMTVTLAKVAGCREIVACTPCGKDGQINTALLAALGQAGANEVYRVGGAQAIAAMACGTKTIRPVQKIFGPGNAYVVAAKRLLFGRVAIDLLPGPSEMFILADSSANPKFAAADLLAQAEHGSGDERVWFASNSKKLIADVQRELKRQLPALSRREFIRKALRKNGWLIHVKSINDGIALANRIAPEHCELMLRKPGQAVKALTTVGAIFVGPWAPTVLGDYMAGPSHTLPTGGAGASFAGLTVDQFQRRTSVVKYSRPALAKSIETIRTFAEMEGLDAHGRSAEIRLED
ncbi:MAG: histidinol dehydrogenase [Verrucomicrobiota bacterium]|nr:histidinol dehydrogenase [Verrucomicrobiota bacterium]|tara:strand:+ start:2432 stop:3727 length:1296 start_codon:yes stop_codon:yes gene_type:complete